MHASGASLLAKQLQSLGIPMPGQCIPAHRHDPEGFFEWDEVVDLQERLLIDLDRWWPSQTGFLPLPANWLRHPATQNVRDHLKDLLRNQVSFGQKLWLINDPRSSLLLPLWRDICEQLDISLQLILTVRNPKDVLSSVMESNERLTGMTYWRAQQLWWRFNSSVLASLPSKSEPELLVVHYESWFDNPIDQARFLVSELGLPKPDLKRLKSVQEAVQRQHSHASSLRAVAPPLDQRIKNLHHWLYQQKTVRLPRQLFEGQLQPLRNFRQQVLNKIDWLWLIRSSLLPAGGLFTYRKNFLQGVGSGPLASPVWITRQRPSLLRYYRDPLAWYQRVGWRLGVNPHPLLESVRLWAHVGFKKEAVALYRREAIHDDIPVHPRFDSVYYRKQCRQADCLPQPTPLEHYLVEGWQQGLAPHPAVDPLWMKRRHGLPGEPLVALILDGGDPTDPGLTHPCGNLFGAAVGEPCCSSRLPVALVDLLQLWTRRGLWPAERWLEPKAMQTLLPSFNLFGQEHASLFALSLQSQQPLARSLPTPQTMVCRHALSWRSQFLLAGLHDYIALEPSATKTLHVVEDADDVLRWERKGSHGDWLINFYWPSTKILASWIQGLRRMEIVFDSDPQRTAFLQLFGVKAMHQPFPALELAADSHKDLLRLAQLKLGLPDPRWFEPSIELAVIGSSGPTQERRWGEVGLKIEAAGLLLLPRLPQLEIASFDQLKALQAWLNQLSQICENLLLLEPIQQGACQLSPDADVLAPEVELDLLQVWESRCL